MNNLIDFIFFTAVIMLVSVAVFSEEVPAALKDASITVQETNGNKTGFSANYWKVVPRIDKPKVLPKSEKKNRVRIMGGVGPQGYHLKEGTTEVNVSNRNKVVFGLGYERKVYKDLSLGAQAISNGTYTLDLGLDF